MADLDLKKLLTHFVEEGGTIVGTIENVSFLPAMVESDLIKAEHVVVKEVFSNPSAQTADWKIITADGSLIIDVNLDNPTDSDRSAAISGATDLTIYLSPTGKREKSKTLIIESSSVSSLPTTITNSNICSGHMVMKTELSNPSAQTADWIVDTYDGKLVIRSDSSSAISGTTNVKLYLAK